MARTNNLNGIVYQSNQPIGENKSEHQTGTIDTTLYTPVGEANLYVWFVYDTQNIWNHTWGESSVSINADSTNAKKGKQSTTTRI